MNIKTKNIYSLIKLNYKMTQTKSNKRNITSHLMSCMLIVLLGAIIGIVFYGLSNKLGGASFKGLLSLLCLGFQFFVLSYSITDLYKLLVLNNDNEIMAYLPVSKYEIYLSKMIFSYLKVLIIFICLSIPAYLIYGILNSVSLWFYFSILLVIILLPVLPFGVANIMVLPITYFLIWLKHKLVLKLILMSVLTIIVFFVYNNLIFDIANILLLDTGNSNVIVSIADTLANALLPFGIFAGMMIAENLVLKIFVILAISIVTIMVGIIVGIATYKKVFQLILDDKNNSRIIKTKLSQNSPFNAFLRYELKSLFRNSTYLFVYFVMLLSMPIMAIICNGFILEFAINKVGSSIIFGVTLFVIMCFISIICSPTASFISKEGEYFWIIKTNPHGIKYPLIAKSVVGVLFAGLAMFATLLAMLIKQFITIKYALIILFVSILFIIGLVSFGINLNLFKPNLFKGNRENNSNIAIHTLVGFLIAIIIGVLSVLGVFILPAIVVIVIISTIVLLFAIINILVLMLFSNKLYMRMEVC